MHCIPRLVGGAEALAELVDEGLGQQRQGHLAIADIEVERAGRLPTQGLVELEELFGLGLRASSFFAGRSRR